MRCARCDAWCPEYREICPFCKHAFPRSLELERSRRRLRAESLEREREAVNALAEQSLAEPSLTFVQRRYRQILSGHLGRRCIYRTAGVVAHCLLVSLDCDEDAVCLGLRNLRTKGFAGDMLQGPDADFTVASGWPYLYCGNGAIRGYGWGIRLEADLLATLERTAAANRFASFPKRLEALALEELAWHRRFLAEQLARCRD